MKGLAFCPFGLRPATRGAGGCERPIFWGLLWFSGEAVPGRLSFKVSVQLAEHGKQKKPLFLLLGSNWTEGNCSVYAPKTLVKYKHIRGGKVSIVEVTGFWVHLSSRTPSPDPEPPNCPLKNKCGFRPRQNSKILCSYWGKRVFNSWSKSGEEKSESPASAFSLSEQHHFTLETGGSPWLFLSFFFFYFPSLFFPFSF